VLVNNAVLKGQTADFVWSFRSDFRLITVFGPGGFGLSVCDWDRCCQRISPNDRLGWQKVKEGFTCTFAWWYGKFISKEELRIKHLLRLALRLSVYCSSMCVVEATKLKKTI